MEIIGNRIPTLSPQLSLIEFLLGDGRHAGWLDRQTLCAFPRVSRASHRPRPRQTGASHLLPGPEMPRRYDTAASPRLTVLALCVDRF